MAKTVIIIPSRLSAKRLPSKPLLEINNIPMIVHVYKRALEANVGEVYVATPDKAISDVIKNISGKTIHTNKNHKTGSDRVFEAYKKIHNENNKIDLIINLQGDMPNIDPKNILTLNNLMKKHQTKIGTLASKIIDKQDYKDKNIVKVETEKVLDYKNFIESKNFFRTSDINKDLNIYHHIGIYCYSLSALEKFINFNQTENELKNRLEQLRAIDNNIKLDVALAKSSPIGVDTHEDYIALKKIMEYKS